MKLLIDTHVLLWILQGSSQLTARASDTFKNIENEAFVSAASYWELCLKISLGKLRLSDSWESALEGALERNTIQWLPIKKKHLIRIIDLPWIHRDPFDRLLVAQAIEEDLTIITADSDIHQYSIQVVW